MNPSREHSLSRKSEILPNMGYPENKDEDKVNIELIFDGKDKEKPLDSEREELNKKQNENEENVEDKEITNEVNWKEKCKYYLMNLKEILFIILLITINLVNYSILNILYTLIGLILMFFIFNTESKSVQWKNILIKLTLVYNILVLIFKLIFLGFYLKGFASDFVNENRILLINLGLKYLQTEELPKFLNTYLPEGIILVVLILYIIYSYGPNEYITDTKKIISTFEIRYYFLLSLLIIFMVILICLNPNFLTLYYSTILILGLITIILEKHNEYFYISSYFIIFFCDLHILFVHILNIYNLRQKYLKGNDYIYVKWMGFPKMQTNFSYPVDVIISVFLSLTCMIIIKLRIRYIAACNTDPVFKEEEDRNRERERMNSGGSFQSDSNKKGFIKKVRKIFKEWVNSPFFILHFCRLGIIIYLILFRSIISELLFIWLFYSFLITNVTLLKPLTLVILWPILIINFYLYFTSNIIGLIRIPSDRLLIYKSFSLERIQNVNFYFLLYFVDLILITFFTLFLLNYKDKQSIKLSKHRSADQLVKPKNELVESLVNNRNDNIDVKSEVVRRVKLTKHISFYELILKFLLKYIDVITLILMYLIALNEVNIIHLILIIIFLIQLILPQTIKSLCLSIIIIIEVLIFYDFVWNYLIGFYSISPYLYGVMEIIMSITGNYYTKSSENYLWIILYCFYMQYQNYNSQMYKKYESEDYELKKYLDSHLKSYPNLLYYIHKTIEVISQLYIWVIFLLLFIIITLFEINLFFSVKLLLFFIILYMFLDLTYSKNINNSIITVIWVFIIYCGLVTMAIYFYQFTMLGLFSNWFYGHYLALPEFVKNNLQVIGIQIYAKSELTKRFFPHYFSNLLSVLLLTEVKNQIKKMRSENISNLKLKEELEKYEDTILKRMSTAQVGDLKENNLQFDGNMIFSKKKFYFFKILLFLLTCYWLAMFLVVCSMMIDFQISLIMIIYIIVFGCSFIFLFSKFSKMKEAFNNKKNTSFYLTKLIRYEICEKPFHRKILRQNRRITLKILLIITLISIWLTYSYGIVNLVKNKVYTGYQSEFDRLEASSYLIGFYYNHLESLFKFIWGYFVLLILLILDRYVQILHSKVLLETLKLEKIAKLTEKKKQQEVENKKEIKLLLDEKEKTFLQKKQYSYDDVDNRHSKLERENEIRLKIEYKEESPKFNKLDNLKAEDEEFYNKNQSQVDKENQFIERLERKIDIPVTKLLRRFILIFFNYSYNSKMRPIPNNFTIEVQKSIKHVLEEVIVFMIFLCTVIKLNAFSVIYMIILMILQIKGRNTKNIYIVTIILNLLIFIQYSLFFLNLNQNTDPLGYKDILKLIYDIYKIPIYQTFSNYIDERLAYFLSFGTQQNQVYTIWIDFITVIICFFYLDNFSFSIFEAKGFTKSDFHSIRDKSSFRDSVNKIYEQEYNELKENLQNNIDIKIPPLDELKREIRLGSEVSKEQAGKGKDIDIKKDESVRTYSQLLMKPSEKKKDFWTRLFINVRKNIFMSLHNFMLVLILILSLMNDGLISMVYIIYALYYIYISRRFFLGIRWNFPNSLKNFLRVFILVDIFLQILYQNPFNYFLVNGSLSDNIMQIIGIYKIVDYSDNSFKKNQANLSLLILKIITYVLVSLQIIIFNSKQFKAFYIKMLLKQNESNYRASMINSFLFNNTRIQTMNESMAYRNSINETLKTLEKQLESWNKHLKDDEFVPKQSFADEEKFQKENFIPNKEDFLKKESNIDNLSPEISLNDSQMKLESLDSSSILERNKTNRRDIKMRLKIKKILYSKLLIKLAIYLNRKSCSYKFVDKRARYDFEVRIIKGETYIPSSIEKTIDHFIETLDISNEEMVDLAKIIDAEEDIRLKKELEEKTNIVDNQQINEADLKNFELISKKNKEIEDKISENILSHILFTKYLTKCYLFQYCCKKIFYFFLENFHYVCFFFMILNHMLNTSLISLFWPIMVFGYALLEYPKPKNTFWKISLFYSISTIFIKFSFQLRLVDVLAGGLNSEDLKNFNKATRIGIFIFEESLSAAFFNYIIWDCIIILLITIQQYILISQGLWDHIESEIEPMENAYDRVFLANSDKLKDKLDLNMFINRAVSLHREVTRKGETFYIQRSKIIKYYNVLFPKTRNYKPGKDFYAVYFIIMLVLTGYIIIFYTRMDRNINYQISGVEGIREFSGAMVIMAFIHVFFIVVDRVIYIKQNRNKIELDNIYYNVKTGEKLSQEEYAEHINSEIDEKDYKLIYFQNEEANLPLIAKYILHCIIILFSHVIIFWFLPIQGNMNLSNNAYCTQQTSSNNLCNDFGYNGYIVFCYLLYIVYMGFSAMQIKYNLNYFRFGLLDMRKKSLLTRGDNIIYSSCYKGFLAIPFLYELKLCLDWTFTPTSLDLFKWLKFEAVYDILFITHCDMKVEGKRKIGEVVGNVQKVLLGGCGFFILLIILLLPLILFSSLNPANVLNNVTDANIELQISFSQSGISNNYTIYKNAYASNIQQITKSTWEAYGYGKSILTKGFDLNQVQIISMYNTSDNMWGISFPHIDLIKERLRNYNNSNYDIFLNFKYSFIRPQPAGAQNSLKSFTYPLFITLNSSFYNPSFKNKTDILDRFYRDLTVCAKEEMILDNFYVPSIRLSAQPHPKIIVGSGPDKLLFRDVKLNLECEFNNSSDPQIDFTKSFYNLSMYNPPDKIEQGIVFHTFSDKVSSTNTSYDVLTFYISFILVVGRLVRGAISGEAERIVFTEMPEPKKILNLCEGVKIHRYRCEFEREEHLYYVLIDLMRSPEILKIITKSSIRFLLEKKEKEKKKDRITKKIEQKEEEKERQEGNKLIEEIKENEIVKHEKTKEKLD